MDSSSSEHCCCYLSGPSDQILALHVWSITSILQYISVLSVLFRISRYFQYFLIALLLLSQQSIRPDPSLARLVHYQYFQYISVLFSIFQYCSEFRSIFSIFDSIVVAISAVHPTTLPCTFGKLPWWKIGIFVIGIFQYFQ